jgi:hypothetical protein
MQTKKNQTRLILILCLPFMLACAFLDRLIQVPEPTMETNTEKVLEVLNGNDWEPLQSLTAERYTEADYAKPGTLTFTAKVTNEKPVFFSYGWCASDEEILIQNFEHITVRLYLNDGELGSDVVHNISYSMSDGKACLDFGILLSGWPAGEYQLKAVAIFDEKLNDGFADYDPGEYIYEYNVTVAE